MSSRYVWHVLIVSALLLNGAGTVGAVGAQVAGPGADDKATQLAALAQLRTRFDAAFGDGSATAFHSRIKHATASHSQRPLLGGWLGTYTPIGWVSYWKLNPTSQTALDELVRFLTERIPEVNAAMVHPDPLVELRGTLERLGYRFEASALSRNRAAAAFSARHGAVREAIGAAETFLRSPAPAAASQPGPADPFNGLSTSAER